MEDAGGRVSFTEIVFMNHGKNITFSNNQDKQLWRDAEKSWILSGKKEELLEVYRDTKATRINQLRRARGYGFEQI